MWRDKTLIVICLEALLLMIGAGFLSPILPGFVLGLGVSPAMIGTMVGLAITAFGVTRTVIDIPAGNIARLWGRRPLLILGPSLVTVSALGYVFVSEYWQLVAFRLLQGLGSGIFTVAAMVVIGEISTEANRGQYMSLYWGSFLLGLSFGPTLGGFIGEYLSYRAVFLGFFGLSLAATILGYFFIPETRRSKDAKSPDPLADQANSLPLRRNMNFWLVCALALLTLITISGNQITLIPILGYERLELTEGQVGLALTLAAITQLITVPFAGRLSDRLGRKRLIVPGGIITMLGLLMFTRAQSYSLFLVSGIILGLGMGFGGPLLAAYVADIAPPGEYERTMAIYRTVADAGWVIGPIMLGWLNDVSGINSPFFLTAALFLVTTVCFAALAKESVSRG
jgi:MFS family permease